MTKQIFAFPEVTAEDIAKFGNNIFNPDEKTNDKFPRMGVRQAWQLNTAGTYDFDAGVKYLLVPFFVNEQGYQIAKSSLITVDAKLLLVDDEPVCDTVSIVGADSYHGSASELELRVSQEDELRVTGEIANEIKVLNNIVNRGETLTLSSFDGVAYVPTTVPVFVSASKPVKGEVAFEGGIHFPGKVDIDITLTRPLEIIAGVGVSTALSVSGKLTLCEFRDVNCVATGNFVYRPRGFEYNSDLPQLVINGAQSDGNIKLDYCGETKDSETKKGVLNVPIKEDCKIKVPFYRGTSISTSDFVMVKTRFSAGTYNRRLDEGLDAEQVAQSTTPILTYISKGHSIKSDLPVREVHPEMGQKLVRLYR